MGCGGSKIILSDLNINIHTSPAFSSEFGGEIKIECDSHINCDWKQNGSAALLQLSSDRKYARNVPPGIYEITCTSNNGECITSSVEVKQLNIPSVNKYIVYHATSDYARDGKIEVEITNISDANVKFLWTTGVITDEPILYDVKPGTYAVTLVSRNKLPIIFYHGIMPAVVEVKKNAFILDQ